MSYSIATLEADLAAQFHGTATSKIVNLTNLENRAARQVLFDCDPQETIRIAQIATPVFNSVWDYPVPSDLKGNAIIDIRPQVDRNQTDVAKQVYNQTFDTNKLSSLKDMVTIQWNGAVKTMRLNLPQLTAPTIINDCSSTTSNGTWTAGSSASGLANDNVNFVSGGGALSFNLAAAGSTGYLENSTMSALDLTSILNQGYFFLYTFLPTGSVFSNINIRIGSSASNYYSINATVTQENTAFANGWNLIAFPWANATTVGTPTVSALNYIRITWTYNGTAQTAVRLDQITAALGSTWEIEYYSKFLFRDSSTNTFAETVATTNDLVNLDTETYNLYLYKVCELAAQQTQGLDAMFYDGPYYQGLYQQELQRYQALYKSQKQKPQSIYYKFAKPRTAVLPILK